MTTTIDSVEIPSLIFTEQGSAPASPSSGDQRIFIRTSDHVLCYVDSSGTVTPVGGALGSATPQPIGAAGGGSATTASKVDHVHAIRSARVAYTGGDISFTSTSFAELVSGIRLTIAAAIGDVLLLTPNLYVGSAAQAMDLDGCTIISGAIQSLMTNTTNGASGWRSTATSFAIIDGCILYTVVSGDISAGNVVVSMAGKMESAGTRLIQANADLPLVLSVVNLGH